MIEKAPPIDTLDAITFASKAPIDLSFIGLFMQADLVVKSVMIILFIASIWSWAIIFDKLLLLRSVIKRNKTFESLFWSSNSLQSLYEKMKDMEKPPLGIIFTAAMQEWQNIRNYVSNSELKISAKERLLQAMYLANSKSIELLEKNISFLATLASSGTFIGLFGTVWGIMVSFQSIAISKNTTLAVVAPGIAEALLATAFGLIAAIPASIFYNKFVNDINRINTNLENFTTELSSIMSRQLDNISTTKDII